MTLLNKALLNVGLVGYGFAGKTFHAPLISACPDLSLHTVVSTRPEAVHADWPEARVVPDLATALADPEIDLVVIATPDALHAEQAEAALNAGKAVVVDKPFALSLADARRVVDLADEKGLFLSVFQNRRWDADFLALKAEIASGRLGRIVTYESHFDRYRPVVRDRWREAPGAGVWQDLGPHLIDQALNLFGRPEGITCDLAIQRDGGLSPDRAHATLRYDGGLRVVLNAAMLIAAPDVRFAVHGSRASFLTSGLDPQEDQLKAGMVPGAPGWGVDPSPPTIVEGETGARTSAPGPAGDYPAYYAAVAKAVRGEGPNPVPPSEALMVMEVLEAGMISSREGREVAL
ncbi:oxidoreductase [Brevundimonas goettingensis]|uniref:Oxidoreductase n=1 Tax=Brevundimonas goettingensis TaxID=2774190 RepID=A0A975GVV1_9CAUL|nr:oxidoreductase [Brevundimonas goettingensis]QTC91073.1 oxidoreductase [Brevundimonas goettingensis]